MNGTADEQCISLNSNTKSFSLKERQHLFVPITDTISSKLLNYDTFNALLSCIQKCENPGLQCLPQEEITGQVFG